MRGIGLLCFIFMMEASWSWALTAYYGNRQNLIRKRTTALPRGSSGMFHFPPSSKTRASTTALFLAARRRYRRDDDHDELSRQERSTDRPTLQQTQVLGPPIMPSKPKIVVLGASGRIGRLVVRQLLEMKHLDATIVACVRHYDKAIRVLYDDLSLPPPNLNSKKKGPSLRIVEADLVPPEELPGYLDADEEDDWRERAASAAEFYNTSMSEYDNREDDTIKIVDANEALQEAIQDCTTIISCVGCVRPTNLWSDFMVRPVIRILQPDVSQWCKDARHPYYVHFASTRKILGFAEREQLRREAAVEMALEEEEETREEAIVVPKIRYIKVSDNVLSQPVWEMVPLVTNIFRSMVFRYIDMADQLLESSTLVDTVILRPGDLVDDERDVNTAHLQVDPTGEVPQPAVVSREDVASLAVASALFRSPREIEAVNAWSADDGNSNADSGSQTQQHAPFHCTLGVRWVGDDMHPYPAQGRKRDGSPTAQIGLEKALSAIKKNDKKDRNLEMRRQRSGMKTKDFLSTVVHSNESYHQAVLRMTRNFQMRRQQKRQLKPYAVVAAIPVYFVLALVARKSASLLWQALSGQVWAQPLVVPLQEMTSVVLAFLFAKLAVVQQFLVRNTPRGFGKIGFGKILRSKTYISF